VQLEQDQEFLQQVFQLQVQLEELELELVGEFTGEGISVSTLSVETSTMASSTLITSPTFFNQRVTVPSVTDSPSWGIVTLVAI